MKIILSDEDIIKLVYNAFCNGGLSEIQNSDVELRFFEGDYTKAKDILKAQPLSSDTICYEDVLVQLFKDGKLIFVDHNDDKKYEFTPALVRNNIDELVSSDEPNKQAIDEVMQVLDDDGDNDAWTNFNTLQFMIFKEIVYG